MLTRAMFLFLDEQFIDIPVIPGIQTHVLKVCTNSDFITPDIDECSSSEANECDSNALCTNTEGSYVCRCIRGYEGDGRTCSGKAH